MKKTMKRAENDDNQKERRGRAENYPNQSEIKDLID